MIISPYPPAPWHLQGKSYQLLNWIEVKKARLFIPSDLEIVTILGDYTAGGIYFAQYISGSVLEYSELIVVPGIVKFAGKIGAWVSHIYVDHPDSVRGGREIWGLPKELAQFSWEKDQVSVYQDDRFLARLDTSWQVPLWKQSFTGRTLSGLDADILMFSAHAEATWSLIHTQLTVSAASPFASLNLENSWISLKSKSLKLEVEAPQKIGDRTNLYSSSIHA